MQHGMYNSMGCLRSTHQLGVDQAFRQLKRFLRQLTSLFTVGYYSYVIKDKPL